MKSHIAVFAKEAVLFCLMLLTLSCGIIARAESPVSYTIHKVVAPEPDEFGYISHVNATIIEDGKVFARGMTVKVGTDDRYGHWIYYPDLQMLDLVPMFQGVYRVLSISGEPTSVAVYRMPAGQYALPEEAQMGKGEFAFSVGEKGGGGKLHGMEFKAMHTISPENKKSEIVLEVPTQIRPRTGGMTKERKHTQVAGLGGELRIGDTIYEVVNIVPPNKEKQIIGWFEVAKKEAK